MENNHLTYFKIENFKKFDSLEVKNIGQFNLIVGDNNVGKTCLLEALLFDENNLKWSHNLHQTLYLRGIHLSANILNNTTLDFPTNGYFKYILQDIEKSLKLEYTDGEIKNRILEIKYSRNRDLSEEDLLKRKDEFQFKQIEHWLKFYKNGEFDELQLMYLDNISLEDFYFPFIQFNLSYSNDVDDFINQLDKIREDNNRKLDNFTYNHKIELIKILNTIFDFDIIDYKSSSVKDNDFGMISIATSANDKYIPITQFGDGFNKIFRYIVEIMYINERGESRIMIDEVDTGIHYSKLKDFWINIINVCKELGVQLFATTHSKDCIEAIIEASKENQTVSQDVRLIKLMEDKENRVKAITYPFDEFEYLVESETETR
jgi:AAA15 family ATPase/GTPase